MSEEGTLRARVDWLIKRCGDSDSRIQQAAREELESIGALAVPPLIKALQSSKREMVRYRAAEALGSIGDSRAIDPLIVAMGDGSASVQWRAVEALIEIGSPALLKLEYATKCAEPDIQWGARAAVKGIRARQAESLIETLDLSKPEERWDAVRSLVSIGEPAVDVLASARFHEDATVRAEVQDALREIQIRKRRPLE